MKSITGLTTILMLLISTGCTNKKSEKQPMLNDSQIVEIMLTIDQLEIAASEVALHKHSKPAVLSFANYLIEQHHDSSEKLSQLAKKLEMTPQPSEISNQLRSERNGLVKQLKELQGEKFDHSFVEAMIQGHRDGLHLIDTVLLPQTKNAELKQFVEQFRIMVHQHLERGLAVQKQLSS